MNAKRTAVTIGIFFAVAFVSRSLTAGASGDYRPDANTVLGHLNEVINWYRDSTAGLPPGELPSDAIYQQNVRSLASQTAELAFESARAEAVLLGESSTPSDGNGASAQNYSQMQEQISQRVTDNQAKLDALNKSIGSQSSKKRQDLLAQRQALTGQIDLDKALLDAIQKMSSF